MSTVLDSHYFFLNCCSTDFCLLSRLTLASNLSWVDPGGFEADFCLGLAAHLYTSATSEKSSWNLPQISLIILSRSSWSAAWVFLKVLRCSFFSFLRNQITKGRRMKEKGMKKGCVSLYSWKKIMIIMYMNGLHCHLSCRGKASYRGGRKCLIIIL